MVELIIDDQYGDTLIDKLYHTPQDAFEAAQKFIADSEEVVAGDVLHPLETWHRSEWDEGFRLRLTDWSWQKLKFYILERKIYPLST